MGGAGGTISNCYSTGTVGGSLNWYVGGLVGQNGGAISNCSSMGNIIGYNAGGLVGYNSGSISNCYSTGTVGGHEVGGLVGYVIDQSSISSSYFLITSGPNNGYGTPLTDTQMKQQASFVGWDFNDVWHICETTN